MIRDKILYCTCKVNLAKLVATHLVGKQHSHTHRIMVGLCFIIIGVVIGEYLVVIIPGTLFHILASGFGYTLHGFGVIPIINKILDEQI
jgi:hypothetical protein